MRELELAGRAVELALAAGASDAEATAGTVERFHVEARDRTVTKLERSTGRSLSVRVFVGTRKATLSTTESGDALAELLTATVDAARFVADDADARLPDEVATLGDGESLAIFSDDVGARSTDEKREDALAMERACRAADPRIDNSNGSNLADSVSALGFANSRGVRGGYRATSVLRSANPLAADGAHKRSGHYGSAARGYAGLEPVERVAAVAARRALEQAGARKPPTMRCSVIFDRDVAARVLGDVFSAVSGANVAARNSFLGDRLGERIGSEAVTIVDDGRLPGGLATAPFDAEGIATRRTVVFERGRLRSFLCDSYYARRLGVAATGNAVGGGVGARNFHLVAGEGDLETLIEATTRGVLVTDTIGFSNESVTGTYSRGARGFLIENGERAYPIDEFTIAGNLPEMLAAIDAVAADLVFDGSICAPSFRVAEMTVSGD